MWVELDLKMWVTSGEARGGLKDKDLVGLCSPATFVGLCSLGSLVAYVPHEIPSPLPSSQRISIFINLNYVLLIPRYCNGFS